jgi:hypothetical protein
MGVYTKDELDPEDEKEINPSPVTPIRPTVVQPASAKPAPVADAEYEVVDAEFVPPTSDGAKPEPEKTAPAQTSLIPESDSNEPKVFASPNMLKIVSVKLTNSGIPENDLLDMMGIGSLPEMEARHVNGATKWIADESARRNAK